jgi:hypothetical protein
MAKRTGKRNYFFAICVLAIVFPFALKAQVTYEDVVYLKNGSIIHGVIIEQVPNQSIKIQTRDGNVFVYRIDEVEKMTKEQVKTGNAGFKGSGIKQSGFTNITELNFGIGLGNYNNDFSYGIQTINGYLVNPYFSAGLGIGVDKYRSVTFIPLFADFRANFINGDVSPFLSTGIGYSLSTDNYSKGGFLLNPALGVKFFVSPSTALNFSLGYRLQEYNYSYIYYFYGDYNYRVTADYLTVRLGATF